MTQPSREELLACPFCGPGNSMVDPWFDDVSSRWAVGCGRCGASSGRSVHAEGSKEAAIKAWNTRAGFAQTPPTPRLETMTFDDVDCKQATCEWPECECPKRPKGGFACPHCGTESPHHHSEAEIALRKEALRKYYAGTDHHPVYRRIFIDGGLFALSAVSSTHSNGAEKTEGSQSVCICDKDHPTFKERGHHPHCPASTHQRELTDTERRLIEKSLRNSGTPIETLGSTHQREGGE